jgi:AraC-like DNA-binding protein
MLTNQGGKMSAIVVCYERQKELNDINKAIDSAREWKPHYFSADAKNITNIERQILENEAYFLICSKIFSDAIAHDLHELYVRNPLLTIIYFYSVLNEREFVELHRAGIKYCFVGAERESNLKAALRKLSRQHWKKIPESIYASNYKDLAPRAKKTLKFIEHTPIKYCNTETIARFLNISQSHFRKEFKKYFDKPFRVFKQELLQHYENILLFEKKLRPHHIYSILDYKNLSAFSRSFKARHGVNWQNMVKSAN